MPAGPIRQVIQYEGLDHLALSRPPKTGDLGTISDLCNFTLLTSVQMGRRSRSYQAALGDFGLKILQMGALLRGENWAFSRLTPSARRVWMCLAALGRELERPGGYTLSDLRVMGRFVSTGDGVHLPGRDAARGFVKAFETLGVLKRVKRRGHNPTYSYRNRWVSALAGSRDADLDYARNLLRGGLTLVKESGSARRSGQVTPVAIGCYCVGTTRLPTGVRQVVSELVDSASVAASRRLLPAEARGGGLARRKEPNWLRKMSSGGSRSVLVVDLAHFLRGSAHKPGNVIRGERAFVASWRAAAARAVANTREERPKRGLDRSPNVAGP